MQSADSATLKAGGSLAAIAHQYLGDFSKWREIADFNGVENLFSQLPIGTELKLPSVDELRTLAQDAIEGAGRDLASVTQGKFYQDLQGQLNEQIKLIDWLY